MRIAIVTATRAEYGLLTPLIKRVASDEELELELIVTGTHLSERFGNTIDEIIADDVTISYEIPILYDDNSPYGISMTMANAIKGFAECFNNDRPDMVLILGDRTEMLAVTAAAMNEQIPIAHIHGGEVTEGAVDDYVRHAITKMSYLHFTSAEAYRNRVIQLGESPSRVFNVGGLGTENILTQELYSEDVLLDRVPGLSAAGGRPYSVLTFHPVTLEDNTIREQVEALCSVLETRLDIFFIITAANADAGGSIVNEMLQEYSEKHQNASFSYNLGLKRYLSAVKHAAFVIGNSSSGILEAPVLGTPTVNIGDRQRGRLMAETIINCEPNKQSILDAIEQAIHLPHISTHLYGDGHTSEKIISTIKYFLFNNKINLKKGFYDINQCES